MPTLQTSFEIMISPSQIGLRTRWNCECLERVGFCVGDGRRGGDGDDKIVHCVAVTFQNGVFQTYLSNKSFRQTRMRSGK
jgi:hypothetical protein